MARKKTLEELQIEREKAEQDLRMRQENLKKLKQKEAELTRNARTHRLCTHGAIVRLYYGRQRRKTIFEKLLLPSVILIQSARKLI